MDTCSCRIVCSLIFLLHPILFSHTKAKLYHSVIDEVIESMREAVLEEGIDDQVLAELKQVIN